MRDMKDCDGWKKYLCSCKDFCGDGHSMTVYRKDDVAYYTTEEVDLLLKQKNNNIIQLEKELEFSMTSRSKEITELKEEIERLSNTNNNPVICLHNYIQQDEHWRKCTHCGMVVPLFNN